jgi:hypothetical protein
MSVKAIDVRVAAGVADRPWAGHATEAEVSVEIPHRPGAMRTTVLMALVTFREAARRKILWIATLGGAAILSLFGAGLHAVLKSMPPNVSAINRSEGINMMIMMVLYAGSMITSLMAALKSCDTLSGEIDSGTIHAIRPRIHRNVFLAASRNSLAAIRLVRQVSDKTQIDVNLLGDLKNEYAWILQTPLDVRDDEVSFGCALCSIDVDLHRDSQFMRSAV